VERQRLAHHKEEVQLFLQHSKLDILLVSEVHFTTKTHFQIPQYNTYYTNHPDDTAHAGIAIIMKHILRHHELSQYAADFLQATSISVSTLSFELTVYAVYSPLNITSNRSTMKLSSAPWAQDLWQVETSIAKTQFGDPELLPLKVESCLTSCSNETTHSYRLAAQHIGPSDPAKQPDLLDFFVKNGISSTYFDIEPSYDLSSDHSPIIATISTSPIHASPTPGFTIPGPTGAPREPRYTKLYTLPQHSKAVLTWRQLHMTLFAYYRRRQFKLLPQKEIK